MSDSPIQPTLLVVDDESGPRQAIRMVFKSEYRVLMAASGEEAVEIAAREPVDVAVVDIMMGGMSGIELLQSLKERDPDISVVILTAYETLDTARQALRLGASDYLNKPFDVPAMRDAVQKAMRARRERLDIGRSRDELGRLRHSLADREMREEMVRTKGEIYAGVLHDLNGPLTVISAFAEIIDRTVRDAERLEGSDLEALRGGVGKLSAQVARCYEISRRYLQFLRSGEAQEARRISSREVLLDLAELLSYHPDRKTNDLDIRADCCEVVPDIDSTDLLQILLNLTINALQSAPETHRVTVSCSCGDSPATLAGDGATRRLDFGLLAAPKPAASFHVADDGPGIEPEILGRIFNEQVTTKAPGKGTGLGLSIIRRLVERAGGAIEVESRPGTGTRFAVHLPQFAG